MTNLQKIIIDTTVYDKETNSYHDNGITAITYAKFMNDYQKINHEAPLLLEITGKGNSYLHAFLIASTLSKHKNTTTVRVNKYVYSSALLIVLMGDIIEINDSALLLPFGHLYWNKIKKLLSRKYNEQQIEIINQVFRIQDQNVSIDIDEEDLYFSSNSQYIIFPEDIPEEIGMTIVELPINNNSSQFYSFASTEEEELAKLDLISKLGEIAARGIKLSQNYNITSDYKAMKYEYELHKSIMEKNEKKTWLKNMILNGAYGFEFVNEKYNPFGWNLKGLAENISENIEDYDDILNDIYENYLKDPKPMPPSLKLIFFIISACIKLHLTNQMVNNIPSLGDFLNNNPDLAEKLRKQAEEDKKRSDNINEMKDKFKNAVVTDYGDGFIKGFSYVSDEEHDYESDKEIEEGIKKKIEELQKINELKKNKQPDENVIDDNNNENENYSPSKETVFI